MPAVYVRILAYVWGEPVAARACLLGETFTVDQAGTLGILDYFSDLYREVGNRSVSWRATASSSTVESSARRVLPARTWPATGGAIQPDPPFGSERRRSGS
jgi:hypothetical protein